MATTQTELTYEWTSVAADAVDFTLQALSPIGVHVCFGSAPAALSANNWIRLDQGQGVNRTHGAGEVWARSPNSGITSRVAVIL